MFCPERFRSPCGRVHWSLVRLAVSAVSWEPTHLVDLRCLSCSHRETPGSRRLKSIRESCSLPSSDRFPILRTPQRGESPNIASRDGKGLRSTRFPIHPIPIMAHDPNHDLNHQSSVMISIMVRKSFPLIPIPITIMSANHAITQAITQAIKQSSNQAKKREAACNV